MNKLKPKQKLIVTGIALAVWAGIFIFAVLMIGLELAENIPNGFKLVLFLGSGVMTLLFLALFIRSILEYVRDKKAPEKTDYIHGGKVPGAYVPQPYVSGQNPEEDVLRVPVEYDDEQGKAEQEILTKRFLNNIVYPQGFLDFLTAEDGKTVFIKNFDGGDYYQVEDKYPAEQLIEINEDTLIYRDDYFTQFREVLFFADDESGHMHFLLDYATGGEPKVKILDDELDEVYLLADTFEEFVEKLCTPKQANEKLGEKYYGYYEDDEE
ncbi:MAG: SMI1/KNR4 family protein [Clostridia bacterium]|nr:SMI1/KNR4 family protein [Clostridia bacterium]